MGRSIEVIMQISNAPDVTIVLSSSIYVSEEDVLQITGSKTELTTDDKSSLVAAINEVDAHADTALAHVANDGVHVTTAKKAEWDGKETPSGAQNRVNAHANKLDIHTSTDEKAIFYNKVDPETVGKLSELATTNKDDIVSAINEIRAGAGKKYAKFVIGIAGRHDVSQVDLLCDGTADEEEINYALSRAYVPGGKVLLLDGTYNVSDSVVIHNSNVTLEGSGPGTCIKRMFGKGHVLNAVIEISSSLVTVCNIYLDGNCKDYADIYNIGIYIKNTQKATVRNMNIINNGIGVLCEGSMNKIYDNFIASSDIGVKKPSCVSINGQYNSVVNNYITGAINGVYINGIDILVSNNHLVANSINVVLSPDKRAVISNNCCMGSIGMQIEGSKSVISGNICTECTSTGSIKLTSESTNNLVVGNYVSGVDIANQGAGNTLANNKYMA